MRRWARWGIPMLLGLGLALWPLSSFAHEGEPEGHDAVPMEHGGSMDEGGAGHEGMGHSHEKCEIHGGSVTMSRQHHFETVFAPDGLRIYIYSGAQDPMAIGDAAGTATVRLKNGTSRQIPLVAGKAGKGEKTAWFCPMHPGTTRFEPGNCPTCGMTLVPQDFLQGKADFSQLEPGAAKATVHVEGLAGDESEVTFTETFQGFAGSDKPGEGHGEEHGAEMEPMGAHRAEHSDSSQSGSGAEHSEAQQGHSH